TVLWRFYHNKLPCRARLHQFISDSYPSDSCIFCDQRDTDQHFIWNCPKKRSVWDQVATVFL
ncbi:hypothetical protein BDB00DRAFT_731832, partial [Zychaea mexicana]|uniref:uncharacterized protein n=1 Tax=Zychaea mexicana TaxID=64656 RepID=UPI0022FF2054